MSSPRSDNDSTGSSASQASTKPARRYSDEDKARGLAALAVHGPSQASKITGWPRKTIESWRDADPERWQKIHADNSPFADAAMAATFREVISGYGDIERKLLERLDENTTRLDVRDLPAALKNVTAAKVQSAGQLNTLLGRANVIVEHVDARDLIADIGRMFHGYVDATVEAESPPERASIEP